MTDSPVRLPNQVCDELFRAAVRTTEEVIRLADRSRHDGTVCVLIPERIVERLELAVRVAEPYAPADWRP
jgi:hypothetical protein